MKICRLTKTQKWGLFFIAPWLIFFLLFTLYPFFLAFKNSFLEINLIQPDFAVFVGLENWIKAATSSVFWMSVFNVVYNQIIFITLSMSIAIVLAALLYEIKFLAAFFRTVYFLPYVTSAIVAMLIFNYVAGPQGTIQAMMQKFHLLDQPVIWTMTKWLPMPIIALFNSWKWFGLQMIIFLAAMSGISKSIYEAADIDGAGWWTKLFKITLPSIKPQVVFVLTMNIINGLQMFTEVYAFFNVYGGPYKSGMTPVLYLYNEGFYKMHMGTASAIGLLLALLIFILTKIQMFIVDRKEA